MSIYIYQGSMSADTIEGTDYVFVDGKEYTLPDNHSKTKRMIRQGVLTLKPKTDDTSLQAQTEEKNTKKGAKK